MLSPSYKPVTYQIYALKFKFYAVGLKTRVIRPIMKLDGFFGSFFLRLFCF